MNDLKAITIMFRATDALGKAIQRDVKTFGLNVTEFGILEALYHLGKMPIKALLEKVLITNSSMSYVVSQLITKEYIYKTQSPTDKRSFVLALTKKGQDLMDEVFQQHKKNMREIISVLTKEEEEQFKIMLKKVGKRASEYRV
ncbi:MAG: MarR family transcriptional regulator [Tenericutes bacterium]|jgi:MarR family 2-MHQ and catechol resistance regulon transcriptional repressor|nr:MarR family transcriptional regulator [Mycoplasmatota bacterium]